jgi:hypothetical protein
MQQHSSSKTLFKGYRFSATNLQMFVSRPLSTSAGNCKPWTGCPRDSCQTACTLLQLP